MHRARRISIGAVLGLFVGLILIFGCTIDQGKGTFHVDADVTAIGNTMISIKYYIGRTIVFDDIPMKDNVGILNMIREQNPEKIPLRVNIEFYTSDEPKKTGFLKYYYGANLLGESKSFDVDSLVLIAKENRDIFNWEIMDGKTVSKKNQSIKAEAAENETKPETVTSKPDKEFDQKL